MLSACQPTIGVALRCVWMVGCTSTCCVADSPGFDTEFVVDRDSQTLPAANIAFSGLHRDMPEEKLDLFKLVSRLMAEPRTGPSLMPTSA